MIINLKKSLTNEQAVEMHYRWLRCNIEKIKKHGKEDQIIKDGIIYLRHDWCWKIKTVS
jgi:hypothetical protein